MNPYRHEFQHYLRSKAVIAVAIVGMIAGALAFLAVFAAVGGVTISGSGFWYYSDGTYHIDLWTFDNAGNPTDGVRVDLNLSILEFNGTGPPRFNGTIPRPTVLLHETLTSDSQGRVRFALPAPPGNYSASVSATYPAVPGSSTGGALESGFELTATPSELLNPIGDPFNPVADTFYNVQSDDLLVWGAPGGGVPVGDRAVACSFATTVVNFPGPAPTSFPSNCTGEAGVSTVILGTVSEYRTTLPLPPLPPTPPVSPNGTQIVDQFLEIENSTGAVLYSTSVGSSCGSGGSVCVAPSGFAGGYSPESESPGPSVISSFAVELSLLLPLMALLVTYWSYARPRLTGTLEPVLVRPVTRNGIFLVRYGVVGCVLLVAALAEVLLFDLGVTVVLREPLPASFLGPLVGGLAVAGVGFAGLVFLSAHAFRSTGPVLAVGIGWLLTLSLFFGELLDLALYFVSGGTGAVLNPGTSGDVLVRAQLFAPPQIPNVVIGLLTGFSNLGAPSGSWASAGISPAITGLAAAVWLVVPFLITYRCVTRRD